MWELPYGANFSVAKTALFGVGGFSTQLGRKGKDFSGGEETDLAYRIAANGYDLYYNPFAIVTHYIREERINIQHMIKSAKSSAGSMGLYGEGINEIQYGDTKGPQKI